MKKRSFKCHWIIIATAILLVASNTSHFWRLFAIAALYSAIQAFTILMSAMTDEPPTFTNPNK